MTSRKLKFRAWDKVKDKWITIGFHIIGEVTVFDMLKGYGLEEMNNIHVEQYTGLKDKNGVDIYEGDVLGGYPHGSVYVFFDKLSACFCTQTIDHNWPLEKEDYTDGTVSLLFNDIEDCGDDWSVMGNIHQNPELLQNGGVN